MDKRQILKEAVTDKIIGRLGFNTRVKFKNDPTTYYVKNVKGDRKTVFVLTSNGLSTKAKSIASLVLIDGKPLRESLTKQSLIRESIVRSLLLNEELRSLKKEEVLPLLQANRNKIFTVSFVKKDGTKRIMNAMLGVKRHLKGGQLPYDAAACGLLPVFDLQKKAYRIVTLASVYNIKTDGNEYIVK